MSTPAPPPPPPSADELGAALSATTLDSSAAPGAPAVDLVALAASVTAQGDAVRELKRAGAAKGEVTAAVDKLKLLKIMLANGGVNPEVAAAAAKAKAATVPKRVFAKEPEVLVSDANLDGAEAYGKFYITTAINYANGPPHMGHAYEGLMTDTVARYHRIAGRKVFFLTGADEHGQKIANTAEREGLKPVEICDKYVAMFKHLNTRMRVSNDDYQRTTDPKHEDTCRELWKKCHANGDIYLHTYVGWYLEREEMFIKESDAKEWEYKDPQSGVPLKEMEETCYFFKLSKYVQKKGEGPEHHYYSYSLTQPLASSGTRTSSSTSSPTTPPLSSRPTAGRRSSRCSRSPSPTCACRGRRSSGASPCPRGSTRSTSCTSGSTPSPIT